MEFKFEFSIETGDWSLLQKSSGNKSGGHKRCPLCGLDFSPENSHECLSYANIIAQIPKSIALSAQLFSTSNESKDKEKEDEEKEDEEKEDRDKLKDMCRSSKKRSFSSSLWKLARNPILDVWFWRTCFNWWCYYW